MAKTQTFTISIVGVFLFFAILAGVFAWIGPFVAPDVVPFKPGISWSSAQFHGFAVATGVAVGICAAAVLVLVRRVLPASLRLHIVWLPPDILDRAKLRKQGAECLAVLAIIIALLIAMHVGFLDEDELRGLTPDEVRTECGAPVAMYDHRPGENRMVWIYGHWMPGGYSVVEFRDDVVVSVSHGSK